MMASIKEGVTDDGHTLPINLSPQKKRGLLENTDFVYKNIFHFSSFYIVTVSLYEPAIIIIS